MNVEINTDHELFDKHIKDTVIYGHFEETLARCPDRTVDLVLTDPAYWTLNKWRNIGTTTRLGGNRDESKRTGWFKTIDEGELWDFMCEVWRVLKPDRHAVIMGDGQVLRWLLGYSEEAGFSNVKPLIWDKVNQGMGYHFRCRHEYLVLYDKGKNRKPRNLSTPDIFTVPYVRGGYPTEKPLELMKEMIMELTEPGELVVDPFCGSGTTLVAAKELGRNYFGGDWSEDAVIYTKNRINPLQEQLL